MAIAAWSLLVYKDIYKARFFLDDYLHLHLTQRIHNLLIPFGKDIMMGAFYRPGVFFLWKLNSLLGGLNPAVYYAFNMAVLVLSAILLMQVMQHLTGNKGVSGFATLLFVVSPITALGVLWLSNRFDLLATFFFLLSLLTFLRFLRFRRRMDLTISLVTGFYSYFCKEIAVTLPAILALSGLFMFWYRGELTKNTARRIAILAIPYLVMAAVFMLWRYAILGTMGGYSGEERVPFTTGYFFVLLGSFGDYVWLFASPFVFLGFIALLGLLFVKKQMIRGNPIAIYGLLFAAVTAAPLLMVLKVEKVMTYQTPRFFFLPGIGLAIFLAAVYNPRSDRTRRVLASVFLFLMAFAASVNTFLVTYHTKETTQRAEKQMTKINDFLEKEMPQGEDAVVFACVRGLDVALDSALKIFHPEYIDRAFIVNCSQGTQVIARETLYKNRGGDLTFPKTFTKNPDQYDDLYYGVVSVTPKDMLESLAKRERTYALYRDREARMTFVTREFLRRQMETMGVTFE
jgi:hypothetical protein